ncbi:MAG: hypothetical protein ACE5Q6_03455 [Dehalococcoidia bacterium]
MIITLFMILKPLLAGLPIPNSLIFLAAWIILATSGPIEPGPGQGTVTYLNDTGPDSVERDQVVFFIPEERAAELFKTYDPYSRNLQRLHRSFDKTRMQHSSVAIYTTGSSGRFSLGVPLGRYLVCTAWDARTTDTTYAVDGCDTVEISHDSALTIYHVEGATRATVK